MGQANTLMHPNQHVSFPLWFHSFVHWRANLYLLTGLLAADSLLELKLLRLDGSEVENVSVTD